MRDALEIRRIARGTRAIESGLGPIFERLRHCNPASSLRPEALNALHSQRYTDNLIYSIARPEVAPPDAPVKQIGKAGVSLARGVIL
ncbi:MAG: hypothetical protein AB7S70_11030 [Hyphomicrobium sp.]|uniref:hypothetical protein n=1 Tax=Hyphomicrobium sp. TaxID=82 RepID=UPI003D1007CC